mgnify:CR=1 FL=1
MKENGKQNTERAYKISENRVPARASTSSLKPALKACKSTGCMKNMLGRRIERSSGRPVNKDSPLERTSSSAKSDGSTIFPHERHLPRSSGHKKFGFFQIEFLSSNSIFQLHYMHAMAQISNIIIPTRYKPQITTQ